jgi:hypothetical protein
LLADGQRGGVQAGAGAACEDDAFAIHWIGHGCIYSGLITSRLPLSG